MGDLAIGALERGLQLRGQGDVALEVLGLAGGEDEFGGDLEPLVEGGLRQADVALGLDLVLVDVDFLPGAQIHEHPLGLDLGPGRKDACLDPQVHA